jgi:hypothetical protein
MKHTYCLKVCLNYVCRLAITNMARERNLGVIAEKFSVVRLYTYQEVLFGGGFEPHIILRAMRNSDLSQI